MPVFAPDAIRSWSWTVRSHSPPGCSRTGHSRPQWSGSDLFVQKWCFITSHNCCHELRDNYILYSISIRAIQRMSVILSAPPFSLREDKSKQIRRRWEGGRREWLDWGGGNTFGESGFSCAHSSVVDGLRQGGASLSLTAHARQIARMGRTDLNARGSCSEYGFQTVRNSDKEI